MSGCGPPKAVYSNSSREQQTFPPRWLWDSTPSHRYGLAAASWPVLISFPPLFGEAWLTRHCNKVMPAFLIVLLLKCNGRKEEKFIDNFNSPRLNNSLPLTSFSTASSHTSENAKQDHRTTRGISAHGKIFYAWIQSNSPYREWFFFVPKKSNSVKKVKFIHTQALSSKC